MELCRQGTGNASSHVNQMTAGSPSYTITDGSFGGVVKAGDRTVDQALRTVHVLVRNEYMLIHWT